MNRTYSSAVLLLLLFAGCNQSGIVKQTPPQAREKVTVKVQRASGGETGQTAGFVGTVEASRTVVISSNNSGTVSELPVKEGRSIRKDQLVAKVESQTIRSAYNSAKAQLDQAEDAWERIRKVHDDGSVSEIDYVKVKTQVEQARAAELAARKALWHCTLKAPFDGTVDKVYVSRGVEAGIAEPIARIVDLSSLEVHFPLPENEFSRYSTGSRALVTVPALGKTIEGTLSAKGVVASRLSHSYDCTVSLKGDLSPLMPGMVCKVSIESEGVEAIVVPASAVRTDMQGRYVWTVGVDGTVEKKRIVPGGYSGSGIIVSEGLSEEDLIIVEGSGKVSTGMKVKTVF